MKMKTAGAILSLDQGTTGTTGLLFDMKGNVIARGYRTIRQYYPKPGWVEHDPDEIWRSVLDVVRQIRRKRSDPIVAVGITNQRETTILWDRRTGRPVHKAIVWQDRRTAGDCDRLKKDGALPEVRRKTGLVLDPYFSGTKIAWLLRHVSNARSLSQQGRLAFGTVDSWLIWNLTGGQSHATDPTNASRTLLCDLKTRNWDDGLLKRFGIPESILPEIRPSAGGFGRTKAGGMIPDGIPIAGVAGDQQAALFGQGCVHPGDVKATYGTGAFLLMNTGAKLVRSRNGLLTTIGCGPDGRPAYALEGSVFIAGAVIQWLRDELKIIATAAESEAIANSIPDAGGVHLVPAFTGLGAPWWDAHARGLITGLTRGSGRSQLVRAALESIAFQVADVVQAMRQDLRSNLKTVKVDGGASANGFLMQFQSDLLNLPLTRPRLIETTAQGAAQLAGLGSGTWSVGDLARMRVSERIFRPTMFTAIRRRLLADWHAAVHRTITP